MTITTFKSQTISLDKIIGKNISNTSFKEIISLMFYASLVMSNSTEDPDSTKWKEIYSEFEKQLEEQNQHGWPKMTIIKNNFGKRIDIFTLNEPFMESNNILTLFFRLLFIENYKRPYIFKSYDYHKVMGYKIKSNNDNSVKNLSLEDLVNLLKKYMIYYISIYNNDMRMEYQLGKKIYNQLIN